MMNVENVLKYLDKLNELDDYPKNIGVVVQVSDWQGKPDKCHYQGNNDVIYVEETIAHNYKNGGDGSPYSSGHWEVRYFSNHTYVDDSVVMHAKKIARFLGTSDILIGKLRGGGTIEKWDTRMESAQDCLYPWEDKDYICL